MTTFGIIILIIVSYLLGSVPNGLILGKLFKNVDIRNEGSHNIGATNTTRVLGWKFGLLAFILDALKGVIVILVIRFLGASDLYLIKINNNIYNILGLYGLAAVIGHVHPIFLKFKGGKAVATSYAITLVLVPSAAIIGTITFLLIVYLTKYVSLGSLISTILIFVLSLFGVIFKRFGQFITWSSQPPVEYLIVLAILGFIIIFKHKSNIERLKNGTENKVGLKS